MKSCRKCGLTGESSFFYKDSKEKDGFRPYCKECDKLARKNYYNQNKDAEASRYRNYASKNSEKIAKKKKETRYSNSKKIKEYSQKYHQKNRELRLKNTADWYRKNRDNTSLQARILEKGAKRRAAKMQAIAGWIDRDAVRRIYMEARDMTKKTGVPYQVDHIIPLQGTNVCGLHVHTNLQILTKSENCVKRNSFVWSDQ